MVLAEIAQYLEDANIGLSRGLNLIEGYLPKDPSICVALLEVPGERNVRTFKKGLAGIAFEIPYVQVQVRDFTYDNARAMANAVEGTLEGVGNTDIEGTRYGAILALQPPFRFSRLPDEELTPMVTLGQIFRVIKKRSAA